MQRRINPGFAPKLIILLLPALLLSPVDPRAQRLEFYHRPGGVEDHRPQRDIFPGNKFTFCRVQRTSDRSKTGGPWYTDYPDSDINFPLRLAELTTMDVDQRHVVIRLTDKELVNYPFVYMLEVGTLMFEDTEIEPLRSYLLRGGFLMVDDFWGEMEWQNWSEQISRVLPPAEFPMIDIPITNELFHCVFDINEVPQVPGIEIWRATGLSYERSDAKDAHCRGIYDHNGRLMVVVMHNTDLGDGWEREGENVEYFREFSSKKAYPMGINIVVYAMTH